MAKTRTLTPERARSLIEPQEPLELDDVTSLDAATAAEFTRFYAPLSLDGLTSLDADTALELARKSGHLSLAGLTSLSPEIAEELSWHNGSLCLSGVRELSEEALQSLRWHADPVELAAECEAADELAEQRVFSDARPIDSLTKRHLRRLAGHVPLPIGLRNLTSDDIRTILEHVSARSISFPVLEEVSVDTIQELRPFEADVFFPALRRLSPTVAAELGKRGQDRWEFRKLETLEPEALAELADASLYVTLPDEETRATAVVSALAACRRSVAISAERLRPDAAATLARSQIRDLSLGLERLERDEAEALSPFAGAQLELECSEMADGVVAALATSPVQLLMLWASDFEEADYLALEQFAGTLRVLDAAPSPHAARALARHVARVPGSEPEHFDYDDWDEESQEAFDDELGAAEPPDDPFEPPETTQLEVIDETLARELAEVPWCLDLSRVTSLDEAAATALAAHRGTLCLTALRELPANAAAALAKHEGPLLLDPERLGREALAALAKHPTLAAQLTATTERSDE